MQDDSIDIEEHVEKKPAAPECSTVDLSHEISDGEPKLPNPPPKSPAISFYKVFVPPDRLSRIKELQKDVSGCPTCCSFCRKRVPIFHTVQRGKLYEACTFCIRYCMAEMGWDNQGNYDAALEQRGGRPVPEKEKARASADLAAKALSALARK